MKYNDCFFFVCLRDTVGLPYAMGLKPLANSEKPGTPWVQALRKILSRCGDFSLLERGFNPAVR